MDKSLYNTQAERAVLGAMLSGRDLAHAHEIAALVHPEIFFETVHRDAMEAISETLADGHAPDAITVHPRMLQTAGYEALGGGDYLAELMAEAPYERKTVTDYAAFLRQLYMRRRIVEISQDMARWAHNFEMPGNEVIETAAAELSSALAVTEAVKDPQPMARLVEEAYKRSLENADGKRETAWATGLIDLDRHLAGGFRPGDFVVVSGRPSMGKTAMLRTLASGLASRFALNDRPRDAVVLVSLEMTEERMAERQFSAEAQKACGEAAAYSELSAPNLDRARVEAMAPAIARVPANLSVISSPGATMERLRAIAVRTHLAAQARGGRLGALVVDYLQLVRTRRTENRYVALGEISHALKQLALELGCVVIAGAQINRQSESRSDRRPRLSDLRESGDIEQDADIVIGLYREAYYLEREMTKDATHEEEIALAGCVNKLTLVVDKNRSGRTGDVEVYCNLRYDLIDTLAPNGTRLTVEAAL